MNAPPENDNARGQAGIVGKASATDNAIFTEIRNRIKVRIQNGETVSPADFEEHERAAFWAAIPLLRDELPNLKPGWRTLEERHLDGLRLRQRIYRLRGAA